MSRGIAVVTFPGSNGDTDAVHAFRDGVGVPAELVDYRALDLGHYSAVVLPGGFSYGDYLRPGAIARFAPAMNEVRRAAERGVPVLGICNGFQVLTEAHLLPGALVTNESLRFQSEWRHIRVTTNTSAWTGDISVGDVLYLPIAHGMGNYTISDAARRELWENDQVVFQYCGPDGTVDTHPSVNGSIDGIAGVRNKAGNVLGLMPHPERAADPLLGSDAGLKILRHALAMVQVSA